MSTRRQHDHKPVLVRALACQGLEVWLEYEEWRYNNDDKTALAFEKAYLVRKQENAPEVNPARIGVDELLLGKMGWRIVVSDLDAGRPIWIGGNDRSQESFQAFYVAR